MPWWAWSGGVFGAYFLTAAALSIPKLGAAGTISMVIGGQLIASLIFDHFGVLQAAALTSSRLFGGCCRMIGVSLILCPPLSGRTALAATLSPVATDNVSKLLFLRFTARPACGNATLTVPPPSIGFKMTFTQAIGIAVIQGITELFPISSLGHAVVLPALFLPNVDLRSPAFLPFLVVLHLGTATALLAYFWRDWLDLIVGVFKGGTAADGENRRRLLALIIAATIPAVILGFAFEKQLKALFGEPKAAAAFLIANGFLLAAGEFLRKRGLAREKTSGKPDRLSFAGAIAIGVWQCLAFFPGISRSGATMVGGLLAKLTHEQAARFSFLLATPVIVGAAVLEIPKLLRSAPGSETMPISTIAVSGAVAGIAAYLSVAFLMRYFRRHEFSALYPFAIYCIAFGAISLAAL